MTTRSFRRAGGALWVVGFLVGGCSQGPSEGAAPTVSYYRVHAQERSAEVAKCADDPGDLGKTPACVNARAAEVAEDLGSFRKLPPMGLPTAPPSGASPGKP